MSPRARGLARLLAIVLGMVASACRGEPGAASGGALSAGAAAPSASSAHQIHVPPALIAAGRVRTAKVASRSGRGPARFPAEIVEGADGAADAGSLVAGRIASFVAREGDRVERGDVLAWLDAPEAARALADVVRARARTEAEARRVARFEALVAAEAGTRLALDEARLALSLAKAELAASRTLARSLGLGEPASTEAAAEAGGPETSARNVRALGARVAIRSPLAGTVVERRAALGAHVTPEMAIFHLVADTGFLVEARLPAAGRPSVAKGEPARLLFPGETPCDATVVAALPQIDPVSRTRRVRLLPGRSCGTFAVGTPGEVELTAPALLGHDDTGSVLVVPRAAVVDSRGAAIVFVARGEPGSFDVRPIEPGDASGDERIVRAGLAEGEAVVVEGNVLLKGELFRAELGGGD